MGLDNSGWMPVFVANSALEGDNLRLMRSVLNGKLILMGRSAVRPLESKKRVSSWRQVERVSKRLRSEGNSNTIRLMTMLLLMIGGSPQANAFRAYDCNNTSAPLEHYSLLEPEPCGDGRQHEIERTLFGEIVQMKKERLVQVTRCVVFETITSQYCGWQSRAGVVRYLRRGSHWP